MNIDFENALTQEPVQAVMMVIMRYLTDEQRKIVWEKLGRRVDQSLPDEQDLEKEAEALWPHSLNIHGAYIDNEYNYTQSQRRAAFIAGRRKSITREKELEEAISTYKKLCDAYEAKIILMERLTNLK